MRTLCIATAFALLATPAAHAGSIIDSLMSGSGVNLGDCNSARCGFSVGKQKFVVKKSDVTSVIEGFDAGDKLNAAKAQLKARERAQAAEAVSQARAADRAAPPRPRETTVATRADDRPVEAPQTAPAVPPADPVAPLVPVDVAAAPVPAPAAKGPVATNEPAARDTAAASDPRSPVGEWITEGGEGRVRIRACGQALCGIISGVDPKETDIHNPDASKRNRPLLGTPVLIDMKPANSKRWEGEVYNAKNGKTYAANISLKSADVLRVEGCVFGGFFCGGENWTRAKDGSKG